MKNIKPDYIKQQVGGEKRFNPIVVSCQVESLVPQGNQLFVIARYADDVITQDDGTLITKAGGYVGNEANFNENDLVLNDVLIPSDIDLRYYKGQRFERLIGQTTTVELVNRRPTRVFLSQTVVQARTIPREILQNARANNDDRVLNSRDAYGYVENAGFTKAEFESLSKEKLVDIKPKGYVLVYGDTADWFRESEESAATQSIYKDISDKVDDKYVLGLPVAKLRLRICYTPPTIFSGF